MLLHEVFRECIQGVPLKVSPRFLLRIAQEVSVAISQRIPPGIPPLVTLRVLQEVFLTITSEFSVDISTETLPGIPLGVSLMIHPEIPLISPQGP